MVRALLDGRKTQTRREIKNVPEMPKPNCHPSHTAKHDLPYLDAYCGQRPTEKNPRGMGHDWHWWQVDDRLGLVAFRLPYAPGDRLWVREAHYLTDDGTSEYAIFAEDAAGVADHFREIEDLGLRHPSIDWSKHLRLRPSVHMPRWASRLTLTVTDVRVQRLQDISEADAIAEGCRGFVSTDGQDGTSPREEFQDLWNTIHGPDAWSANPWVAAYTFTVQRGNIDEMGDD